MRRLTLLLALVSGYLTSASALAAWLEVAPSSLTIWGGGGIALLLGSFATYLIIHDLTGGGELRIGEWLWLAGSSLALLAPFGMAFAVAYGLKLAFGTSVSAPVFVFLACLALLVMVFLPAWPVAQMRAGRLVNPWRVFRATKGYRWGLVLASFVPSSIDKIVSPIKTSRSVPDALLRFAADGLINAVVMLILGGIAATAWQFARSRDPALQNQKDNTPV